MNTLAAITCSAGPSIVVDFGTTTNFDVVSRRGEFLGGALAPGHRDLARRPGRRAAQLRKVELVRPRSVIGKNTVEACSPACSTGSPARSTGSCGGSLAELGGGPVTVVATGGLAPLVVGECGTITTTSPT